MPICPSPTPRTHPTPHTPAPRHSVSQGSRQTQGVEGTADGFQEQRAQGPCVSASPVSQCCAPCCSMVPWWSQLPSATGEASLPSFQLAKSPSPSPVASPGVVGLCLDAWKLTSYDTHPLLPLRASGCPPDAQAAVLPAEAAAGPVGGLAGLFLICTCASETEEQAVPHAVLALSTVGAATSAWGGRQVLPETGEAALQQQVKLWPARGDKPVVRGTVPLLSWAVGAAGTKRAGPVLGPAGQHRPADTRPH